MAILAFAERALGYQHGVAIPFCGCWQYRLRFERPGRRRHLFCLMAHDGDDSFRP